MQMDIWSPIHMPMVNTRDDLTSHTKILDRILNTIALSKVDKDSVTTTYKLDPNSVVDIPTKEDCKHLNLSTRTSSATQMALSLMTTVLEQVCLQTTVIMT